MYNIYIIVYIYYALYITYFIFVWAPDFFTMVKYQKSLQNLIECRNVSWTCLTNAPSFCKVKLSYIYLKDYSSF